MSEVTRILNAIHEGDARAAGHLFPLVYQEMRAVAARMMAGEKPGQTLQATALVHEAWLRLGTGDQRWKSRAHFFGVAAEAMRHILIDSARRKLAARHGGGQVRLDVDEVEIATGVPDDELLAVHDALDKLAAYDPRKAELVKLRYFAGFGIEEAAGILGMAVRTAEREWTFARTWLLREIQAAR